jgi:phosphoglycolate phosphatase
MGASVSKDLPIDTVIFDLDGTLVDTADDVAAVLNSALSRAGLPILERHEVQAGIGPGGTALVEIALTKAGKNPDRQLIQEIHKSYLAEYLRMPVRYARPYPGVHNTLRRLIDAEMRLALCTNKVQPLAFAILRRLGLSSYFRCIVTADAGLPLKPDPKPLLHAMSAVGGTIERTAFVGDSSIDVQAARNAGVFSVCVSFGYSITPPPSLGADLLIDDYGELAEKLRTAGSTRYAALEAR